MGEWFAGIRGKSLARAFHGPPTRPILGPVNASSQRPGSAPRVAGGSHLAAHVVREGLQAGTALVGTIDSWLIWNLTGGAKGVGGTTRHVTDVTNASRTLLMDLAAAQWHEPTIEALGLGAVRGALPEITSNAEVLGEVADGGALHGARLTGCIGDQQSAMVGQRCFAPGEP